MNKYHQYAIQLKYEGRSYEDISKEFKGVIKPDSIKQWFHKDGKLYNEYIIYEETQNKEFLDAARREVRKIFSQNAGRAAKAIIDVFNGAIKDNQPHLIVKYADMILNHAEINLKKPGELEEPPPTQQLSFNINTYEQFVNEFRKLGGNIQDQPGGTIIEGVEDKQSQG